MQNSKFIYLEYIRGVMNALPGTKEGICYGTEGFYVQKKLLARMKEDGETLVIHIQNREVLMQAQPDVFYITDHYINSNYVLVKLELVVPDELKQLLITAWLERAPKTLVKEYQAG